MTAIDILSKQTKDAHAWTHKMIDSVPDPLWDVTPDVVESNIAWHVGHLVISEYYHAILVIKGFDEEITARIDLKAHNQLYGYNSDPRKQVGTSRPALLREQLRFMQKKVLATLEQLPIAKLETPVEQPIKQKHPVAITKFDALSWNIKHTMWHCGQMATIKRLVHESYDYGLTKSR